MSDDFAAQAREILLGLVGGSYLRDDNEIHPLGYTDSPLLDEAIAKLVALHEAALWQAEGAVNNSTEAQHEHIWQWVGYEDEHMTTVGIFICHCGHYKRVTPLIEFKYRLEALRSEHQANTA